MSFSAEVRGDLSGSKGETVFFVLGMLDEYLGRQIRDGSDRVEGFYCNEHECAFVFRAYLDRLAREQGLDPRIQAQWRQDCLVSFYSKEITGFIDQFYVYEPGDEPPDANRHGDSASLSWAQVGGRDRALQLAYLAGAYFRYGRKDSFEFANSSAKRNLVAKLLTELGCPDTKTESREGLPFQNEVFFTPTEAVQGAFARMPAPWALLNADSVVGVAAPDELAIYGDLISLAREGRFEGCVLSDAAAVRRFTTIPMVKIPAIPGVSTEQREALDDYNRVALTLRSVSSLADESPRMGGSDDGPLIVFGRVGYSRSRKTAAVFFSFSNTTAADSTRCIVAAVAFLSARDGKWEVTGYSTP